jgi:hypothetical protein
MSSSIESQRTPEPRFELFPAFPYTPIDPDDLPGDDGLRPH